jgi:hypothetical protein
MLARQEGPPISSSASPANESLRPPSPDTVLENRRIQWRNERAFGWLPESEQERIDQKWSKLMEQRAFELLPESEQERIGVKKLDFKRNLADWYWRLKGCDPESSNLQNFDRLPESEQERFENEISKLYIEASALGEYDIGLSEDLGKEILEGAYREVFEVWSSSASDYDREVLEAESQKWKMNHASVESDK